MPNKNPYVIRKSADKVFVLVGAVVSQQETLAFYFFCRDLDFEFVLFFSFEGNLF